MHCSTRVLPQVNYGFYKHEWIEELQELSIEHAAFFKAELFPLWKASPGDTGERFGVDGRRDSFQATSACTSSFTNHFSSHGVDGDADDVGDTAEQATIEELQAVLEVVLERPLDNEELEQISQAQVDVDSVQQIVSAAESLLPVLRTRAERATQRGHLGHRVKRAVCGADGSVVGGKVEYLVQQQRSEQAKETCRHKPNTLTNPYQRSAAKWLASSMGLPACVAPVATDTEYELFMSLYMKLSKNGKRGVDYQEMCSEWNSIVVEEMKDIKDVAGGMQTCLIGL